ncbi:MAG: hypothetical protein ACOY3I_10490 [Verrucomicrobiota bacterium]
MKNVSVLFLILLFSSFTLHAITLESLLQDPTPQEWATLSKFNETLTRQQFEERLDKIFDSSHALNPFSEISDKSVKVFSSKNHNQKPLVEILFAESSRKLKPLFRTFYVPREIREKNRGKPLSGLRVVIEPANIGGEWAKKEDRSTYFKGYGRINEGDINLKVALILKKRLEELGAKVFMTRMDCSPAADYPISNIIPVAEKFLLSKSDFLPKSYFQRAKDLSADDPRRKEIAAEMLLTKSIEAKARAEKVRKNFEPDITLVIQHNASNASVDGGFIPINRNIFFVHGAYTEEEINNDARQRYRLLTKLLQNITSIETEVACNIAKRFKNATGYPPVLYGDSSTTRLVEKNNFYVVARNIALNREHDGPVVVIEPYMMNQRTTLKRLLMGDYDGVKTIDGRRRISIHQEYANAVVKGLVDTYSSSSKRKSTSPKKSRPHSNYKSKSSRS